MDTKLNTLIFSPCATVIMLLGFTLWFHHKNLKILCNSIYSIQRILKFMLYKLYKIDDIEITWKWFISLKKLVYIWVSEFVHRELADNHKLFMSNFSSAHSLIHPLLSLSTCISWVQVNMISHLTQCTPLVTTLHESTYSLPVLLYIWEWYFKTAILFISLPPFLKIYFKWYISIKIRFGQIYPFQ